MLNISGGKIYLLLFTTFLLFGCGKKITEPNAEASRNLENQTLSSTYTLNLSYSIGNSRKYSLPKHASFEIPDVLLIKKGKAQNARVEIIYNLNELDLQSYEFKCIYIPSINLSEMVLSKCVDSELLDYGDISNERFRMYQNEIIQIKFLNKPSFDFEVHAFLSMKWF